jgi:hypothetical protein
MEKLRALAEPNRFQLVEQLRDWARSGLRRKRLLDGLLRGGAERRGGQF